MTASFLSPTNCPSTPSSLPFPFAFSCSALKALALHSSVGSYQATLGTPSALTLSAAIVPCRLSWREYNLSARNCRWTRWDVQVFSRNPRQLHDVRRTDIYIDRV